MSPAARSPQDPADPDVADLKSVVFSTDELSRRPARPPDYAAENRALVALVEAMTAAPDDILQYLAETALDLCRADSAGLSLLDTERRRFRWAAVAGRWANHLGGGTPRDFGPCGTVLDRDAALLFSRPERHYQYLDFAKPYMEEGLLIPFYVGGQAVGTIWILAHEPSRKYDSEDLRVMTNLAHFAAAAYAARTRQVAARADVSSALAAEGSLRGKLQACTEAIVTHLDAAMAGIWVTTKDQRVLELHASAGINTRLDAEQSLVPVGSSTIGLIAQERAPHVTNDVANDPRMSPDWIRAEATAFAGYPLVVGEQTAGALAMFARDPISQATIETLRTIADTIAQGIRRAQDQAGLAEARSDLAASRARIVTAGDEERRRVVRDLHDGAQQRLVHTTIMLKQAREALQTNRGPACELVDEALRQSELATDELRKLARGIHPSVLTLRGLSAAIEGLADRMPVPVELDMSVGHLPPAVESTAYFVVAEALTNVAKHARAGNVEVRARVEDGTLAIRIRDDGVGGARSDGSGLVGLSDRVAALDGRLRVENPAAGGSLVAADIPLPS
jgi:signal transduction histidine kinase